jgi:hypothetical protein
MRVLALYRYKSLDTLRRIFAPYAVLANRGHQVTFKEVEQLNVGLGAHADLVVVQNWSCSAEDGEQVAAYLGLCQHKTLVYDLTDPELVELPIVQEALRAASGVTVPTEYLKREVQHFARRVRVVPSTFDREHFQFSRKVLPQRAPVPVIGCFNGTNNPASMLDWLMIKEALLAIKEKRPHLMIVGDTTAVETLGADLVTEVRVTLETYPTLLYSCTLGLCPVSERRAATLDPILAYEYGAVGRPTIVSQQTPYSQALSLFGCKAVRNTTEAWYEALLLLTKQDQEMQHHRAELGQCAYQQADAYRSVKVADHYLRAYREMLPQLSLVQ